MGAEASSAAGPAGAGWAARIHRYETWPTLALAAVLILAERVGPAGQLAALAGLVLLWVARRRATGRWTRRTLIDLPVLGLLATLPGAILVAPEPAAAWSRALSLLAGIALAYALVNFARSPRRAWLACTWLLWGGLALVAMALVSVDWLEKYALFSDYLRRLPRLIGAVPHPMLEAYGPSEGVGVHPNSVAGLLILFLPLSAALLLGTGRADGHAGALAPPAWIRPLAALSLLAGGALLVLTQSRGAWLACAAALALLLLSRWPAAFVAAAGAGLVALLSVLLLGPGAVLTRLEALGLPAGAWAGRVTLWRESVALLERQPWTGIGLGNFLLVHGQRPEYDGGFVYQGFPHAHNLLLQAALDFGLPGMLAVVGLQLALAWAAWRAHRQLAGSPMDGLVMGLAFGLLAHALHGLVDSVSIGSKAGLVPWAFAGLLAGSSARAGVWRSAGARRRLGAGRDPASSPDAAPSSDPAGPAVP